mgnify:CR=1 FL=1
MNAKTLDILLYLSKASENDGRNRRNAVSQRKMAVATGNSLGSVNKYLKQLIEEKMITQNHLLTDVGKRFLWDHSPNSAVILAAGLGMRMVPINMETPKGLIEIEGQPLIERLIRQLKGVGVNDITVVVGFMKERYEYLIDMYDVKLLINPDYKQQSNFNSLFRAKDRLNNSYIVPCDIFCRENPFSEVEAYSWYMVSDKVTQGRGVRYKKSGLLSRSSKGDNNRMLGVCYVEGDNTERLKENMTAIHDENRETRSWEDAIFSGGATHIYAKAVDEANYVGINTYEQLRELDEKSANLKNKTIEVAAKALNVTSEEIRDIEVLKKGMTNKSFTFRCAGKKYIMRIPGEGTGKLVSRSNEEAVYRAIKGKNLSDNVVYIDGKSGYKITEYIENAAVCDRNDPYQVKIAMKKLRQLHDLKLQVDHEFEIYKQIDFYESLIKGESIYRDYAATKERVFALKSYVEANEAPKVLSHIDPNVDNFLFTEKENGEPGDDETDLNSVCLIDWEYAGMHDPDIDIAFFIAYIPCDRAQVDKIIDMYFDGKCEPGRRVKIYCYISAAGLLWSNWCEYKLNLGVEFGEYSLMQYRYAKDYAKLAQKELKEMKKM